MIVTTRYFYVSNYVGINVLLLKDWHSSIQYAISECFTVFDEYLLKSQQDQEMTLYFEPKFQRHEGAFLNTASLAASKCLGNNNGESSLYTIALSRTKNVIWRNHCPWIHLLLENKDGQIDEISNGQNNGWSSFDLDKKDIFAHVFLFNKNGRLSLKEPEKVNSLKLFNAQRISEKPELNHSLSFQLQSKMF